MKRILFLLFVAVGLASCSSPGEKVLLRFQPENGSSKTLVMEMVSKMEGMPMETRMGMTTDMKVTNVSTEGEVEIEATYSHVKMSVDAMGQKMGYDSGTDEIDMNDPSSLMYLGLAVLLNKPVKMSMDKYGKVVKAPDINSLFPDSLRSLLGDKGSNQGGQMFDNMFSIFPEEEVGAGDTWERDTKVGTASGPVSMKAKYKVDEITASEVKISLEGDFSGDMAGEMGSTVKMSGTMVGKLVVDRKTGWTTSIDMTQDLKMNTMGMKMSAKNTITITAK